MARIVLFVDGSLLPPREGATCRFLETARLLASRHEVIVIHAWRRWSDWQKLAREPFRTLLVHPHNYYQGGATLHMLLGTLRPDWIQTKDPEVLATLLTREIVPEGTRVLFECHDVHVPGSILPEEERYEHWACQVADAVVCLTKADRQQLASIGCSHAVAIPCSLPSETFTTPCHTGQGRRLAFLGNLFYGPNREAAQWLCEAFLPQLHRMCPDSELHFVGDVPAALCERYQSPHVFWHGYSEDLAELKQCDVGCSLVLRGTGFRVKTLDYVAAGLPVLANSLGVAGIGAHPCFCIEDSLEALVESCARLLCRPDLRQSLATAAQEVLRRQFSPSSLLYCYQFLDAPGVPKWQSTSGYPSWVQGLAHRQPQWLTEMLTQGRYSAIEDPLIPPATYADMHDPETLSCLQERDKRLMR